MIFYLKTTRTDEAIERLKNQNNYIVGFPKCGQCSLERFLLELNPNHVARKVENIWLGQEAVNKFLECKSFEWQPVIIIRNNADRIWSNYWHFDFYKEISFPDYLNTQDEQFKVVGLANPIEQGKYEYWMEFWKQYNPVIVQLEEMIKLSGFPHENQTLRETKPEKMPKKNRKLVDDKIK